MGGESKPETCKVFLSSLIDHVLCCSLSCFTCGLLLCSAVFSLHAPIVMGSFCRETLRLGAANLPWIDVLPAVGLNVYSILQRDHLIITRDALDMVVERLRRPMKPWSLTP